MNPDDILHLTSLLKHKIEKTPKYKPAYAAIRKYLEGHCRDFISIDGELASSLLNIQAPAPTLNDFDLKGKKCGTTSDPEQGVIFRGDDKKTKQLIKASQFHRCTNSFLEGLKVANENSKRADEDLKQQIHFKINWILLVRKWLRTAWRILHEA